MRESQCVKQMACLMLFGSSNVLIGFLLKCCNIQVVRFVHQYFNIRLSQKLAVHGRKSFWVGPFSLSLGDLGCRPSKAKCDSSCTCSALQVPPACYQHRSFPKPAWKWRHVNHGETPPPNFAHDWLPVPSPMCSVFVQPSEKLWVRRFEKKVWRHPTETCSNESS